MYRQYSQAILARYRCIAYRRVLSAIKAIAFFICAAELRYLVVIELSHVSAAFFQPSSILLLRMSNYAGMCWSMPVLSMLRAASALPARTQ